ncbi:cytidine deaminase (plasmid) [Haladaptatus sp. SPP-AMP-3]|uniref:cytidine deaminase n=1 Tax=Haladaptatus sp. SPP-AMP-3 TaxID=3121295 RepID=UPI003C2C3024
MDDISIETHPLTDVDERLIERAREATETAFDAEKWGGAHVVGAALRTESGEVYTGVSMPASVGRVSMCAEPVALGSAIADGETAFTTSVAVRHPLPDEDRNFEVVPACGVCRELLADYGTDMEIIVPYDGELRKAGALALLPTRNW